VATEEEKGLALKEREGYLLLRRLNPRKRRKSRPVFSSTQRGRREVWPRREGKAPAPSSRTRTNRKGGPGL